MRGVGRAKMPRVSQVATRSRALNVVPARRRRDFRRGRRFHQTKSFSGAPRSWQTPQELPDLRRVGIVALDTETNDEGLRADRGSAWPWRGGYICGISVAWREDSGIANYFPLRHPDSQNFDRENVTRWLKDHIAAGVKFTTQNGLYDWGWLRADLGVAMPPSDQLEEIGALATLIDENLFQLQPRRAVRRATDCPARTRHCWRRRSRPPASRSASRTRYNRTFGKCRRVMSAATPRQIRSPR